MADRRERMLLIELVEANQSWSLYMSDLFELLNAFLRLTHQDIEGMQQQGPTARSFEVVIASDVWQAKRIDNL